MLIKREILEKIRSGEITLQFRRWRRRTVKPGGTLKTAVGVLAIGAITPTEPDHVTDGDARRAGFRDASEFRRWLETMKAGQLDRIELSYLGDDPRAKLRGDDELTDSELEAVAAKLDAMDRRSGDRSWTADAMELIDRHPGRRAEELAREAGQAKLPFKAHPKAEGARTDRKPGDRLSAIAARTPGACLSRSTNAAKTREIGAVFRTRMNAERDRGNPTISIE